MLTFSHNLITTLPIQVNEVNRQLQQEEEACQQVANATKKLEGDANRLKEEVETMGERWALLYLKQSENCKQYSEEFASI